MGEGNNTAQFENNVQKRRVDFGTLDMRRAGSTEDEIGVLLDRLKRKGHYKPGLVFRGFNGAQMSLMRSSGIDTPNKKTTFAVTQEELESPDGLDANPFTYAFDQDVPAIAVYDGDKLLSWMEADMQTQYEYSLKKGFSYKDAIVGAYFLKYPPRY